MLPKEKKLIWKLRRRVNLLIICLFLSLYWVKVKYDDYESIYLENESLSYDNMEKDSIITTLKAQTKPVKEINPKIEKKESKNKINTIKKDNIVKDTIIPQIEDTSKSIVQDSL
jgi:hypothetical protein